MDENSQQCAVCGSPVTAVQKFCSNCGHQLPLNRQPRPPVKDKHENYPYAVLVQAGEIQKERPTFKSNESNYWIISSLLLAFLLITCVVLIYVAPGIGIGAAVIVLPAFVRTSMLIYARRKRGFQTTHGRTAFFFLTSTSVAVLFSILTGVLAAIMMILAGVIALFSLCFSGGAEKTAEGVFVGTLLMTVPIFLVIAAIFIMWSYSRWKREVSRAD